MLVQGVKIMVIGVSGVFAFLIFMVVAMSVAAWVFGKLQRFFPETEELQPTATLARSSDVEIAIAIAAAKAIASK